MSFKIKILGIALAAIMLNSGCAKKAEVEQKNIAQCEVFKTFASATFEVEGDMAEAIEKTAKKALTKSCFKKSSDSNANLRIKLEAKKTLQTESGFIQDKHDNSFDITIHAIMLIPTDQGGLTTLTSTQHAKLNLKSSQIADLGSKSEITEKDINDLVEENVLIALKNLFKDMP
ncbi:hypothetical protein [Helicobacter bilis]|uniref:Uncharacterized protein n=1 Tax=Helicobacter bilis TaxID=37372 RepID=A0A4U8UD07_9HELI|nr:hypothetical protein [Helicobacter bilis]MCI7410589.1 hypothetical protein [Helicobacter bilis]MDD7297545.1 hypothetical protein [Helicobacter bilis]MDY4399187.1 hypothetical protein [Helicobacter bilis]TLE09139.1 hypothetical protein LS78_003285 [Helicobacter bilis]TLE11080.1 hypothetical protein LS79_003760 [Helicobacter bilis]